MTEEQERIVDMLVRGQISRRRFLVTAIATGLSASAASAFLEACGNSSGSASGSTARRGGTLRVAYSDVPDSFDPGVASLGGSHLAIEQIYDTLVEFDAHGNVVPSLAQKWEQSSDGRTYTFHLRSNVTFHNGQPLTADDVKFTIDRLLDPKTGYPFPAYVNAISEAKVIDPATVQFTLKQPLGPFLAFMAFPGNSIVPKSVVTGGGNLRNNPIGSGPFQFVKYDEGRLLSLKRNDKYFMSGRPYVDTLEHYLIADATARTNALLGGIVDFSTSVAGKDWHQVSTNPDFVALSYDSCHWHRLEMNNRIPPYNDVRVRQAIGYAIDRQAIIDGVFFGQALPILGGQIPRWNWAYDSTLHPFSARPDVQKAKQLLAAAGYPNGFKAQFTLPASFDVLGPQGPIFKDNLQAVGIDLQLQSVDSTTWLHLVFSAHNFQMSNVYRASPAVDPDEFVYGHLRSGQPTVASGYSNSKMDSLIDSARFQPDDNKRKPLYAQIQELEMQDLPLIPLVSQKVLIAHTKKVNGFVSLPNGLFKTLRDVWVS